MDEPEQQFQHSKDSVKRSFIKAVIYRTIIIILDFVTVYILTGKVKIAVGYMIISNAYTTLVYIGYERIWQNIHWGRKPV